MAFFSTAPADVSQGVDRTVFRLWDPVTIRRVSSWLGILIQDVITSVMDCVTTVC